MPGWARQRHWYVPGFKKVTVYGFGSVFPGADKMRARPELRTCDGLEIVGPPTCGTAAGLEERSGCLPGDHNGCPAASLESGCLADFDGTKIAGRAFPPRNVTVWNPWNWNVTDWPAVIVAVRGKKASASACLV